MAREPNIERQWQMIRVEAGDYLLPSNDGTTLWRINSYFEDGSAEYQHGDQWRKLTGTFWASYKYIRPMPNGAIPDDLLDWENWQMWESTMRTRHEAIQSALRVKA